MRRLVLFAFAAMVVALPALLRRRRTNIPSKPIKIIVPYAPGGATDIVARILGEQMRQILGQSVVVENKPGAFGILAIEEMARSKPDGYTLMIGNVTTNAITPVICNQEVLDQLRQGRRAGDGPGRYSGISAGDDDEFFGEVGAGTHRLRQEKPRQGALRHGRRRLLSALRHGLLRQEGGRSRHDRDPQQGRRVGHHQRHGNGRHAGLVPQRRLERRR